MKEKFREIFSGLQSAYGQYQKGERGENGKQKGKHLSLENRSRIIFGKTILMGLILLLVLFQLMNIIVVSGAVLILISIILTTKI